MITVISSWRRSYALVLTATLLVVIAADYLLYDCAIGWTSALVVGVMLVTLGVRDTRFLRPIGGRVFAVALIGLLLALVEQPTTLNICYALACLATLSIINSNGWVSDFWTWVKRVAIWLNHGWTRIFADNGLVMRWLMRHGFSPRTARGIAAWFVPVLLSGVFLAIFALANPIIARWFSELGERISKLIERLPEFFNPYRIAFWTAFATFAWMLYRGRVRRSRKAVTQSQTDEWMEHVSPAPLRPQIPASFAIRCLILFNLVFVIENVLDARYLLDPASLPSGMSYTEYVHRGAYPLVGAALLAAAFVLITFRPASATESSRAARVLVYAWTAQTIVLTLSAGWRLQQYVAMSELTRWRVASMIWFGLVAMGLAYIVWRIVGRRSNTWLVNINAVTALLVLYPCCFINFDGFIAEYNYRHCIEIDGDGTPFPIEYSLNLGTPSLPALERASKSITDPARRALADQIVSTLRDRLKDELSDWRSWTWRRYRTARQSDMLDMMHPRLAIGSDGQSASSGLK